VRWPRGLAIGVVLLLIGLTSAQTPEIDTHFQEASETILCDCGCHPQSVDACSCGRAAEMRGEMREMAGGGMTGDEIIEHYVELNGDQIRIAPVATGFNLIPWLLPLVLLLGSGSILIVVIRKMQRRTVATPSGPQQEVLALPDEDDPYMKRLRDAVKDAE